MYKHEDLFIKICDNFHNEINPSLVQIAPTVANNFWFERKSILGKFFIIKNILLSLNGNDIAQYQIVNLQNILKKYKIILDTYFESHNIATCFVYFAPENLKETEKYLNQFSDIQLNAVHYHSFDYGKIYMLGIDIIGFPNDCEFKLSASIKNGKISIEKNSNPYHPIEKERGKLFSDLQRTIEEQDNAARKKQLINPKLWEKKKNKTITRFEDFTNETHAIIISLLNDFDKCNYLCNSLIESILNSTTPKNLAEYKRIHSVLHGTYIEESLEKFVSIFNSNYSGVKLIWLKSGPELKYFIDQLNIKLSVSDEINKWADARIIMKKPIKDMPSYLSKQTSKTDYVNLTHAIIKKDLLYKLFRE